MTSNGNNGSSTPPAAQWTPALVQEYAAGAARLEMWTIPLYLCVAYSIKNPDNPAVPMSFPQAMMAVQQAQLNAANDPQALQAQLAGNSGLMAKFAFFSILSVAIQEMLHCELAANLCNAIGGTVDFTGEYTQTPGSLAPVYDAQGVPYINVPSDVASLVQLGPLDANTIQLLQWVEHYDPSPSPDLGPQPKYNTIGDFYASLKSGVDSLWTQLYPQSGSPTPDDLNQKDDWQTQVGGQTVDEYSFSIQISGASSDAQAIADNLIEAIVSQGEGAQDGDHVGVNPAFQMQHGNVVEIVLDKFTHLERFTVIRDLMELGITAETWQVQATPPDPELLAGLQQALSQSLSSFLDALNQGFHSSQSLNLDAMAGIGSRIYEVWQNGGLPDLSYQVYQAPQYPHACQGLNACAGQGFNNTGTAPGDGDCATAWFHTCGGTNKCTTQGGCGYAVTSDLNDFTDNWIPDQNTCGAKGGCGAPIPATQKFNTVAKYGAAPATFPDGDPCAGADVWSRARKIFEQQYPDAKPAPATNKLRQSLNPTAQ